MIPEKKNKSEKPVWMFCWFKRAAFLEKICVKSYLNSGAKNPLG